MVICLERGADLHMAQLMPLPLTVCSVKSRLVLPFWYQLTQVVGDKGPLSARAFVYVHCCHVIVLRVSKSVCCFVFLTNSRQPSTSSKVSRTVIVMNVNALDRQNTLHRESKKNKTPDSCP